MPTTTRTCSRAGRDGSKLMQDYINANQTSFYSMASGQTVPDLSGTMTSADLSNVCHGLQQGGR